MLEIIVDNKIVYVVTGGVVVLGVVSKIISNVTLKRMVKAAGNMSKSNHALMRLVRAKFEHACMVSEKVENVKVFVEKYLYEYKTLGLKLHTWRRIQMISVILCLLLGALGSFLAYSVYGMSDEVIRSGAYGGILGVLLYLFHLTTDEKYRLEAVKNYMVDYLENVCLHKYEKLKAKPCDHSEKEPMRPNPAEEVPAPHVEPEIKPPAMPEPYEVPDVTPPIKAMKEPVKEISKKEEKKPDKDVLIRQILEEFMA